MFELIIKNYEWIFSGIGILGITAVFNLFKKKNKAKENNTKIKSIKIEGSKNSNVQVANNLVNNNFINTNSKQLDRNEIIFSKSPVDILNEIKAAPPFHQKAYEKSYEGNIIHCVVFYRTILLQDGNIIRIMTSYGSTIGPSIVFSVNIEDYPIFKVAKENTEFLVKGKIQKIEGDRFYILLDSINEHIKH